MLGLTANRLPPYPIRFRPLSLRCLITAGPTREFFDPVRFISNPSTGKMGFALAAAAKEAGWTVDLVAGPVSLPEPAGVMYYPVVTAAEMHRQADALFGPCDVLIMTAAVSDWRPAKAAPQKLKKDGQGMTVALEPVPDIVSALAEERRADQFLVGFAAETEDVEANALDKLERKGLDLIAANSVAGAEGAFGSRHGIGGDEVEPLALELVEGVGLDVLGLGGEAHQELVGATLLGEGRDDVRHGFERDRHPLPVLLQFLRRGLRRSPVADRGGHDQHVARAEQGVGLPVHLGGGDDGIIHHPGRLGQRDGPGHEVDRPAGFLRGGGQGEAHLARRRVADEAHRIEELAGRTGGDEAAEGQGTKADRVRR